MIGENRRATITLFNGRSASTGPRFGVEVLVVENELPVPASASKRENASASRDPAMTVNIEPPEAIQAEQDRDVALAGRNADAAEQFQMLRKMLQDHRLNVRIAEYTEI